MALPTQWQQQESRQKLDVASEPPEGFQRRLYHPEIKYVKKHRIRQSHKRFAQVNVFKESFIARTLCRSRRSPDTSAHAEVLLKDSSILLFLQRAGRCSIIGFHKMNL